MYCGTWIATEDGIYSQNTGTADVLACRHPILPVKVLKNLETDDEKVKLAYKKRGVWKEMIVTKDIMSSANKITSLYGRGISVTSENAKCLVRYLQDIEDLNNDHIPIQYSTSKLGWKKDIFLPYDEGIVFDGDVKYKQVYESISPTGSRDKWFNHVRELRKLKRMEINFMLAASFSSVLVAPLDVLSYIVDLWGETGGGKSVSTALSASIWGKPTEDAYIKDYQGSPTAIEVVCDLLNSLPLILDDSSKMSRKVKDDLEELIYNLTFGKGKSRSNKDLGLLRENHWKNCTLTNGERALSSYVTQGGAINRILEIECGSEIFRDAAKTIEVFKRNYGHAGYEFIDVIKKIGLEEIKKIQKDFMEKLADDEKMQKQCLSLSVILTADKIATDYLFKDGECIDLEEAKKVLVDRSELSENERCYRFVLDKVSMNPARFDCRNENVEKWGVIENGYAFIYVPAFDALCREGGFSKTSFLSWANREGLIQTENNGKRLNKLKSIGGNKSRCVCLKLDDGTDKDGFMKMEPEECLQEELPFK